MSHHLYRHYAADGCLLYIGISLCAFQRLGQHSRHSGWFNNIARVEIEHFETRSEALAAERLAIQNEKPVHNSHFNRAPTEYVQEAVEIRKRREAEGLYDRIVNFAPFYKLIEVGEVLRCSTPRVKQYIEDGELGAVVLREDWAERDGKSVRRTSYGVTGWQLIEFLEYMTREKAADY